MKIKKENKVKIEKKEKGEIGKGQNNRNKSRRKWKTIEEIRHKSLAKN